MTTSFVLVGGLTRTNTGSSPNSVRAELNGDGITSTTPGINTFGGQRIEMSMPAHTGPFEVRGSLQGSRNYLFIANAQIYQSNVEEDLTSRSSTGEVEVTLIVGAAAVFLRNPASDSVSPCDTAAFVVETRGCSGESLQWRRNGTPLADGTTPGGSIISGSATNTLTISWPGVTDSGQYDCVLTNECGGVTSEVAALAVCSADSSCDGQVDDADFVAFAFAYNLLVCEDPSMPDRCPNDLNDDGMVDDLDFVAFAAAYDALLCP